MRYKLKELEATEISACGIFLRYNILHKNFHKLRVALICDLRNVDGELLADHIWLECPPRDKDKTKLEAGDIISFDGTVKPYVRYGKPTKWVEGFDIDYTLTNPNQVIVQYNTNHKIAKRRREQYNQKVLQDAQLAKVKADKRALELKKIRIRNKIEAEKALEQKRGSYNKMNKNKSKDRGVTLESSSLLTVSLGELLMLKTSTK